MSGAETEEEPGEAELSAEAAGSGTDGDGTTDSGGNAADDDTAGGDPAAGPASDPQRSDPQLEVARSNRKPAFAVARAIVVLAIAGAGYALIIPTHHDRQTKVVSSRLSELTVAESGVDGFNAKPSQAGVQPDGNVGLNTLTQAAKRDPGHTGLYTKSWTSSAKGSTDGVGLVLFLLPTPTEAQSVLTQVNKMELGATSQSANSLKRTSTFTVDGVPGSQGSVFEPTKPTNTSQDLAVASFREGSVVSFVQMAKTTKTAAGATSAQDGVTTLAKAQSAHLKTVEPGFTLIQLVRPAGTSYPTVASIVWIAGSVVVALLAAIGPFGYDRVRRRRQERLQAELDRMIVVRGQTITKRRL